jgi:hypothetical protein
MGSSASVIAGGEVQVESVQEAMGFWVVQIAQVMDGDHTVARVHNGQDMGWNEEQVWRVAGHLPGEAQVGPEAGEGHDLLFIIGY